MFGGQRIYVSHTMVYTIWYEYYSILYDMNTYSKKNIYNNNKKKYYEKNL